LDIHTHLKRSETLFSIAQIAALRRTKKGSPLILLDKAGNTAKIVAKELAKLGYGKVGAPPM
jgi:rhodanese-related sulfurtransferase